MAISDSDLSITTSGDIRWTGNGTTTYTVLELHRWLQDKADDALAGSDDLLDITDVTPSDRSTDNIITLLVPYNINDEVARHLYDGSITQDSGDTVYSGLVVVGASEENIDKDMAAFISDDGGVLTDETTPANEATADDMTLMPTPTAADDRAYFGQSDAFKSIQINVSTVGTGTYTVSWEYYNGSAWVALINPSDGTTSFKTTGENTVSWDMPLDWAKTTVDAQGPFYYIRAVSDGGTQTAQPLGQQANTTNGTHLQISQDDTILASYWQSGINADAASNTLMRNMVKTRQNGCDIDEKKLRVWARELGNTYSEFLLTAGQGNNTAAIFTGSDLNNQTVEATISGWSTVSNTEGFQELDIDGTGTSGQEYYSQWNIGSQTINETYERTKWIQRRGTSTTIHSMNGDAFRGISHEIAYDGEGGGPFDESNDEVLVWGSSFNYDTETGDTAVDVSAAVADDGGSLTDETTPANEATADDLTLLPAAPVVDDAYYIGKSYPFSEMDLNLSTQGAGTWTITWEYYNGVDEWKALANVSDASTGFTATTGVKIISWDQPIDWQTTSINSQGPFYYIRARVSTFTSLSVQPLGQEIDIKPKWVVGEYLKFSTSNAVGRLMQVTDAGATGSMIVAIESDSGTIADGNTITQAAGGPMTADINGAPSDTSAVGGSATLLALDDNGADGEVYVQLLTGSAPVNNLVMTGLTSGATGATDTSNIPVTARTISAEFIGTSTGTNIIGAYGIGFEIADVGSSDQFFDLANTPRVPPNNVTFTVFGLTSGEDRVLVTNDNSSAPDVGQLTLNTNLTGSTETAVVVTASIPTDTPATGSIRVLTDGGIYKQVHYSSYTASTFTMDSGHGDYATFRDFSGDNATGAKNVFIGYIDKLAGAASEAFTTVFDSSRTLFIRVRDGGGTPIKTFETTGTLGSAGGSSTAIRTSDA